MHHKCVLRILTSSSACWFVLSRARLWDLHVCKASLCFLVSSCLSATHKKTSAIRTLSKTHSGYSHSNYALFTAQTQSCNLKNGDSGHRRSYKHTFGRSVLEELDHLRHVTGLQVLWVVTTTEPRIGQEWLSESRGWFPLRPSHRRRVTTKHFPVLHRRLPTGAQFPRPLYVCAAAAPPSYPLKHDTGFECDRLVIGLYALCTASCCLFVLPLWLKRQEHDKVMTCAFLAHIHSKQAYLKSRYCLWGCASISKQHLTV